MRLELKEASFSYFAGKRKNRSGAAPDAYALKCIDLKVEQGEMVALAGRSGAGKSTFTQLLKGFINPTEGRLLLDGIDPVESRRPELFDRVGYIFQYPEHQLFAATVYDDISYGLKYSGLTEQEKEARVRQAMDAVGLGFESFAQRSPFELSGGEKRRVAIAGVVVLEPEILILDEPTAGLDLFSRKALFKLLHRLNREREITVLWVSHMLDEILEHAQRLLILSGNLIFGDGPPADLLADSRILSETGWEEPDSLRLARLLKEKAGIAVACPWDIEEVSEQISRYYAKRQRQVSEVGAWREAGF